MKLCGLAEMDCWIRPWDGDRDGMALRTTPTFKYTGITKSSVTWGG